MTSSKTTSHDFIEIFERFYKVGAAMGAINGNNTHSGNISMQDPHDPNIFYITAAGSQIGALIEKDIVPVHMFNVSWGDARGSSESTIHRKILSMQNASSVLHAHPLHGTSITFDVKELEMFLTYEKDDEKGRQEFLFFPVDFYGAFILGGVNVGSYFQPVGSVEMEKRIPRYLEDNFLTVVKGHGPFIKGSSPEHALHLLSVYEASSQIALFLKRRGLDFTKMGRNIRNTGVDQFFPARPPVYRCIGNPTSDISDPTVIADFQQRLHYNYNNQIGAYGTGSMSQKISATEMIYCPTSSVPNHFEFSLEKRPITYHETDSPDCRLHKTIYQHTHQNTCMITSSPQATAEGMVKLVEAYGVDLTSSRVDQIPYTPDNHPVIIPIDAEAIYLNPRLGLVDIMQIMDHTAQNPILNMLRWYKGCCVVAGYGVVSTGDATLEQAAHNASSAERIARFRQETYINHKLLNGPPPSYFEPQ